MRLRWFLLAPLVLVALVAGDSSAQTCDASTKQECLQDCPTVRACRDLLTATCTGDDCTRKAIRKTCKSRAKRCKQSCKTSCLRSCQGQDPDCIADLVQVVPACDPANGESVPITCEAYYDLCFLEARALCREEECCTSPKPRVAITQISCEEVECGPCPPGTHGARWTYELSGTASGGLDTRFSADGRIQDLECDGWAEVEVPLQGPSCVHTREAEVDEITWHASGSEAPEFFTNGCRCLTEPWVTEISVMAQGPSESAVDHQPVTCP